MSESKIFDEKPKGAFGTQEFRPHVKIYTPEGNKILAADAEIKILDYGFNWTEGPVFVPEGNYLLFSDIPENKIYKWTPKEGKQLFLTPSGTTGIIEREDAPGSNGLLLNAEGQLVLCQHGDRRIALLDTSLDDPKPKFKTLADNFEGKRFNSPNDAVFHSNGDLYFTDPPYGLTKLMDDPAKELDFQGVYRLRKNGQVDLLDKTLTYPNGITLSSDEKTLYVAVSDTKRPIWMAYDVKADGLVENARIFYDVGNEYEGEDMGWPDGMKVNKEGYIFATGPEGLWVFNPKGTLIAKVFTGYLTSNCAFSTDEKYIYLTTDNFIMGVTLK